MPTNTVEDYVKQIFLLQRSDDPNALVALGDISASVGVVPGSATSMVKTLAESGLLRYEPRQGVRLTNAGETLALRMLRRHRLIELFLVNVLKVDWSDVHEEAERMEHVISDGLLERIDRYLGHPAYDPHGDPIPNASGRMARRPVQLLTAVAPHTAVTIARISDRDAQFLGYAAKQGLKPGVALTVDGVDPLGQSLTVTLAGKKRLTLGYAAAAKIAVTVAKPSAVKSVKQKPKSTAKNR